MIKKLLLCLCILLLFFNSCVAEYPLILNDNLGDADSLYYFDEGDSTLYPEVYLFDNIDVYTDKDKYHPGENVIFGISNRDFSILPLYPYDDSGSIIVPYDPVINPDQSLVNLSDISIYDNNEISNVIIQPIDETEQDMEIYIKDPGWYEIQKEEDGNWITISPYIYTLILPTKIYISNGEKKEEIWNQQTINGQAVVGNYRVEVTYYKNEIITKKYAYFSITDNVEDNVPPSKINNLKISDSTKNSVTLTWTAVGDDEKTGTASSYDIRYSTNIINEENWGSAIQTQIYLTPKESGSIEEYTILNLQPGKNYYFAIKVADEKPNWSPISNVANQFTTKSPKVLVSSYYKNVYFSNLNIHKNNKYSVEIESDTQIIKVEFKINDRVVDSCTPISKSRGIYTCQFEYDMSRASEDTTIEIEAIDENNNIGLSLINIDIVKLPKWLCTIISNGSFSSNNKNKDNDWSITGKYNIPIPINSKVNVDKNLPIIGGDWDLFPSFNFYYRINSYKQVNIKGGGSFKFEAAGKIINFNNNFLNVDINVLINGRLDEKDVYKVDEIVCCIDASAKITVFRYGIPYIAELKVDFEPAIDFDFFLEPSFNSNFLPVDFNKVEGNVGMYVNGYGELNLIIIRGKAGIKGGGSIYLQAPKNPDYLKKFEICVNPYVKVRLLLWEKTIWEATYKWEFPKSNSLTSSTSSEENSIIGEWELIPRDYIDSDYSNFVMSSSTDSGLLIQNVYPEAKPQIAVTQDLNKVIVFNYDDASKPIQKSFEIGYSYYDSYKNSWIQNKLLTSNNCADFDPFVIPTTSGDFICVWHRIDEIITDSTDIDSIFGKTELFYSIYNKNTDIWSSPAQLTDDNNLNCVASITSNDGKIILLYISDSDNDLLTINDQSLYTITYQNGIWSQPDLIINNFAGVGYPIVEKTNDAEIIVWSKDVDNDLFTCNDREIFYLYKMDNDLWHDPIQLTYNDKPDLFPSVSYDSSQKIHLSWITNNANNDLNSPKNKISLAVISKGVVDKISEVVSAEGITDQHLFISGETPYVIYKNSMDNSIEKAVFNCLNNNWLTTEIIGGDYNNIADISITEQNNVLHLSYLGSIKLNAEVNNDLLIEVVDNPLELNSNELSEISITGDRCFSIINTQYTGIYGSNDITYEFNIENAYTNQNKISFTIDALSGKETLNYQNIETEVMRSIEINNNHLYMNLNGFKYKINILPDEAKNIAGIAHVVSIELTEKDNRPVYKIKGNELFSEGYNDKEIVVIVDAVSGEIEKLSESNGHDIPGISTPGFEVIIFVVAVFICVFIKKRRMFQ